MGIGWMSIGSEPAKAEKAAVQKGTDPTAKVCGDLVLLQTLSHHSACVCNVTFGRSDPHCSRDVVWISQGCKGVFSDPTGTFYVDGSTTPATLGHERRACAFNYNGRYECARSFAAHDFTSYLRWLYGRVPPVEEADLEIFYTDVFHPAGHATTSCGLRHGMLFNTIDPDWDAPSVVYRYSAIRSPFPNNTWIEVTHCAERRSHKFPYRAHDGKALEQGETWFYYRPGSGIYYNTGPRTAWFNHHKVKDPVCNHTCLRDQGFTSVQYLYHADQHCGNVGIEVVDLTSSGIECMPKTVGGASGGTLDLRAGWKADGRRQVGCVNGCLRPRVCADES